MKDVSAFTSDTRPAQDGSWVQIASMPEFLAGRVDIWRVRLDEPARADEATVLSPDEIGRAGRFHFEKDRIHFARCRTALRSRSW
jgi:hypothetical protein